MSNGHAALAYADARNGRKEEPPGSNRGWFWRAIQAIYDAILQGEFWCGGWVLLVLYAGGRKFPLQFVSVAWATGWARERGLLQLGTAENCAKIRPLDLGVMFKAGQHIEVFIANGTARGAWASGGNTTKGGRASNGGEVAENFRDVSDIVYIIKLHHLFDWPAKHAVSAAPAIPEGNEDEMILRTTAKGTGQELGNGQKYLLANGYAIPIRGMAHVQYSDKLAVVTASYTDSQRILSRYKKG